MTSKTDFARHSNNCRSSVPASLISTSCMKVPLAATTPTRVYSMRRQLAAATSTKLESLSRENPQQTSLAPAPLPMPMSSLSKSRTMSSTLKAQPIANHVVSACAIANLYHTSDPRQSSPVGCTMAPNWGQPFLSTACSSPVNKSCGHRNSSNSNCLKSYLASVMVFFIFLHQIDLCYPLLSDKSTNTTTAVFGPQSNNAVRQSLDAVLNTRFVRSYSEEFMTSSEERERGLQFFGGTSAGSTSTRHRIAPYFDTESLSTNVTISEGSAFVHLPCRVKQLGERTLSWIRRKDLQILTVGKFTYTSDQRFQAIHLDNSDDWSLLISYPQKKDAGTYECQVATLPKISLFVQLNVVVSKAKIVESPTLYLSSGSTLNLTCVVSDTPEPPDYIFWYYNGQVINYGSPRGIKVHTEKSAQTISKLAISKVQPTDSGNYSCTPSNAEAAHIAVHIHNNANPAASIQHGKRSAREFGNNNGSLNAVSPNQLLIAITYLLTLLSTAQFLQLSANLPMIQSKSLLFSM